MLQQEGKNVKRCERKRRIRAKVAGVPECPRISVFRSLRSFAIQAIDDTTGNTLAHAKLADLGKQTKHTLEGAAAVGTLLAQRLEALGVQRAVFDRSGYRYHGKVKAAAEALRAGGINI